MSVVYCNTDVPDFELDECVDEPGRIVALAYIRCDDTFTDFTDQQQWIDNIAAETAIVVKNVRGGYPGASFTEAEGFGLDGVRNIGQQHEIQAEHQNVCANIDFYNALNNSTLYRVAYVTSGGKLFVANNGATIQGKKVIEPGLDTQMKWAVTIKWQENQIAPCVDAPTGIFT